MSDLRLIRCVDEPDHSHELGLVRAATEEHVRAVLGYWMREMTGRVVSQVMVYGVLGGAVGVMMGVAMAMWMWGR